MTSGDLLALFRSQVDDLETPYLWTDDEVYGYIDDAQSMFCRKTDGIADAVSAATAFAVLPNDSYKPLSHVIKKIRGATRADNGRPIEVLNFEDLAAKYMRYDGKTGPVTTLVIGEQDDTARTWPVSNETLTINLLIFRLPVVAITDDQAFEISAEHHRHLLHWVFRMAFLKQDSETFDKQKSLESEKRFEMYCTEVTLEQRKKAHKTRVVMYGGL